ncbi:fibronectin type III domain-containing protein [Streptomyces diastatochromogenes]|nr:fibronectin type III domain-containing protein [Streptomyces diastatochromogenes]
MWSAATDDRAVTGYAVYREGREVKDVPATTLMTDVIGLTPPPATASPSAPTTPPATSRPQRHRHRDHPPRRRRGPHAPTAPTALRVTADGNRAATLHWAPARDDTRVTAYDVYRADTRIHTVPGTATTAHLTGLRPGTAYAFTVRARDAAENSSRTAPPPTSPPPRPRCPAEHRPHRPHRHGRQGPDHPHLDPAAHGRPHHPPRTPPQRPLRHHHRLGHRPTPRPRHLHLRRPGPPWHPLHPHPPRPTPRRHLGRLLGTEDGDRPLNPLSMAGIAPFRRT